MARNRFFLLFGFGLLSLFGGRRALIGGASLAGAGALGTVVVSFVSVQKYSNEDKVQFYYCYYINCNLCYCHVVLNLNKFLKFLQKLDQKVPVTGSQISPKMKSREFSIFIIFSDAYTCTYVV